MTPVGLFELVLALLAGALVLSSLAGRLCVPPAAALVVGGMVLAITPGIPAFDLDPDLILVLFLPPLLMSSAYNTAWRDFRTEMIPILMLAVGAVAFTTLCVGWAVHLVVPSIPLSVGFTLGAIVSPPDAVAAKAVLQRVRLPRRVMTILEGESLVNDATGLVFYRFAVAAAMTGLFSAPHALGKFTWLVIGGVAIGLLAGYLAIELLRRMSQSDVATTLTLLLSYAVYLLGEAIGASGVLAVVGAGILFGLRQHSTLDANTRRQAGAVWEVVVYILEAFVFVLIGLALRGVLGRHDGAVVGPASPVIVATIAVVVFSRVAWVLMTASLRFVLPAYPSRPANWSILPPLVIGWAGMRGVVTLAVALALPEDFPQRDLLLISAFAVILFTVLVQGTTLAPIIRLLRLERFEEAVREPLDEASARVAVNMASLAAVEALVAAGADHPQLLGEYRMRVRATERFRDDPEAIALRRTEHFTAALKATTAARHELLRLHRERQIGDNVLRVLEQEYDLEELRLRQLGRLSSARPLPHDLRRLQLPALPWHRLKRKGAPEGAPLSTP